MRAPAQEPRRDPLLHRAARERGVADDPPDAPVPRRRDVRCRQSRRSGAQVARAINRRSPRKRHRGVGARPAAGAALGGDLVLRLADHRDEIVVHDARAAQQVDQISDGVPSVMEWNGVRQVD